MKAASSRNWSDDRRARWPQWGLRLALLAVTMANAWSSPITALRFTPDGSALVSGQSRRIELRSATDGAVQRQIPCDLPKVTSLFFHPRADILAVAGGSPGVSGEVLLLDWRRGLLVTRVTNCSDIAHSVAFDGEGSLLGAASADNSARLWHVAADGFTLRDHLTLIGHAGPILALAFCPGTNLVLTASADRSIKVWSTLDGRLLRTLSHHTEAVHALVFRPQSGSASPVTTSCASAGDDRTIRIWQPELGRMVRIIRYHEGPVFALAYSADGQKLFSAGKEGTIRQIDADSDLIQDQWVAASDWIYALAVSPDGRVLAAGDWSGTVRLWNFQARGSRK